MTYWYLLPATLALLGVAGAAFYYTDGFTTGRELLDVSALLTGLLTGLLLSMAALCTGAGFILGNLDRAACLQQGEKTGMHVSYELLTGCYVRVDGRLIPYDRWVQVSGVNTP